jgi:hypothetical protein
MQIGPDEAAQHGCNVWDAASSIRCAAQIAAGNQFAFRQVMGRDPTAAEIYLMHQQGRAGGIALLRNANLPAYEALMRGTGLSQARAIRHIVANGGNPYAPASQFIGKWTRFAPTGTAVAEATTPPPAAPAGAAAPRAPRGDPVMDFADGRPSKRWSEMTEEEKWLPKKARSKQEQEQAAQAERPPPASAAAVERTVPPPTTASAGGAPPRGGAPAVPPSPFGTVGGVAGQWIGYPAAARPAALPPQGTAPTAAAPPVAAPAAGSQAALPPPAAAPAPAAPPPAAAPAGAAPPAAPPPAAPAPQAVPAAPAVPEQAPMPQLIHPAPLPPGYDRWETAVDDMRRDADRMETASPRSRTVAAIAERLRARADYIEKTHAPQQISANQPIYVPERAARGEDPWVMPPTPFGVRGAGGVQGYIAQRLMQEHPEWTAEQLQAALQSGRSATRSNIGQVMQRKDEEYRATHNGQPMPAAMYEAESQKYQRSMIAQNRWFSGPLGNTVRSLDVVVSHMGVLDDLTTELHNGNYKMFNRIAQSWAEASGQPAPTNFNTAAQIVGTEIMKALTNAGVGTGAEREEMAHKFAVAGSPQQIRGALNIARRLLGGQLNGLRRQFKQSTGLGDEDFNNFLAPGNIQWYEGKDGTVQAPDYRRFGLAGGEAGAPAAAPAGGGGGILRYDSQGRRIQ